MKLFNAFCLLGALLLASSADAQIAGDKGDGMGMMGMMNMPMMQEHMSQMQEHMKKMKAAKTDQERMQLMQEHMEMMDQHMGMMMKMMGKQSCNMAPAAEGPAAPVSEEDHEAHHPQK